MRNYQPKKNNPYRLDHNLFIRMLYTVKDYKRMNETINTIAGSVPVSVSSLPKSEYADSTVRKAIQIERISEECKAIESALQQIPQEYQKIIFDKICYDKPYPLYADLSTYSRWKCRFLYYLAEKLKYI